MRKTPCAAISSEEEARIGADVDPSISGVSSLSQPVDVPRRKLKEKFETDAPS
jgi:hypothetical protein